MNVIRRTLVGAGPAGRGRAPSLLRAGAQPEDHGAGGSRRRLGPDRALGRPGLTEAGLASPFRSRTSRAPAARSASPSS